VEISAIESLADNSSDNDTVPYLSIENEDEIKIEDIIMVHHRTKEEIMAESDISFENFNNDLEESTRSSQLSIKTSIKDINPSLETTHKSTLSFSDDEISTEQFENELADINTKSKDIEALIEQFLFKK